MGRITEKIRDILIFREPAGSEPFVLAEEHEDLQSDKRTKESSGSDSSDDNNSDNSASKEGKQESRGSRRKKRTIIEVGNPDKSDEGKNDFSYSKKEDKSGQEESRDEDKESGEEDEENENNDISIKLEDNMRRIKEIYSIPKSGDVIIREFDVNVKGKVVPAFIVFIDGIVDRKVIGDNIINPLMLFSNLDVKCDEDEKIADYLREHLIAHNQLTESRSMKEVVEGINFGSCVIFAEGMDSALIADVKGWEHRNVDRPNSELVLRGPQEGFTEILRVNTALLRKILLDEELIVEDMRIGKRSKTPCSMLYIRDIANDKLVKEVRRRLKNIKIDYLLDSGELEQLIDDKAFIPIPKIISTERPDRVASLLSEGLVAIIVNGSPFALVVPGTMMTLIHSSEDSYLKFPYGTFLRLMRMLGIILSLLLPGIYIAITNYHQEMIPTGLLFAISAAREMVPFPSLVEILVMEVAFELIREAGIRIPGPIGSTLGIIGALILGQAAVAANIVSPILIIIVAVTGIGSFAIPSFSLGYAFRIFRFGYIILGALAGFLGITTGLFIQGIFTLSAKSFGVPVLVPYSPRTSSAGKDTIYKAPIWKQEKRPDFANTKKPREQAHISRAWLNRDEEDDNNNE